MKIQLSVLLLHEQFCQNMKSNANTGSSSTSLKTLLNLLFQQLTRGVEKQHQRALAFINIRYSIEFSSRFWGSVSRVGDRRNSPREASNPGVGSLKFPVHVRKVFHSLAGGALHCISVPSQGRRSYPRELGTFKICFPLSSYTR